MPILQPSYRPPRWLRHGHVQTVLARSLPRPGTPPYQRRRLTLDDGDFLDLDHISQSHRGLALILHGLESSSAAPYVRGMAKTLLAQGWDIVALNFRGCSGQPNRSLRSYHSGVTDDLRAVLRHLNREAPNLPMLLLGFSLGGNVALRFLGEEGPGARAFGIAAAAAISVPSDLQACADRFTLPENRFYMKRFLRCLFEKVRHRQRLFPDALDYPSVLASENFHDFDGRFTAPVHGFASAEDYWDRCSARPLAAHIAVPTLCLNAHDDPFLSPSCHLIEEARDHPMLCAETPDHGGHVGFLDPLGQGFYHQRRVAEFMRHHAPDLR